MLARPRRPRRRNGGSPTRRQRCGASPSTAEIFEAVTREVGLLCDADLARMERFEPDDAVTAIAAWTRDHRAALAVDARFALEGESIAVRVRDTGRPARVDSFAGARGPIAREAQTLGVRASIGCPIAVGGRLSGVIAASKTSDEPFPPLELALRALDNMDESSGRALLVEALEHAEAANRALRERAPRAAARRAHPRGTGGGRRVDRARTPRARGRVGARGPLPAEIEASAYFVVAEALTDVVKHSAAQHANVAARIEDGHLRVDVSDDGVGGAHADGSGLLGLRDRVVAPGGDLEVDSPTGAGTRIAVTLPLRR